MNHFNRNKFIKYMREEFPEPMKHYFTYNLLENIVDFVVDLCEHDDAPENIVQNLVDLIPLVKTEEVERFIILEKKGNMRDLQVGDTVICKGIKCEIAEIAWQEPWSWRNSYYLEFTDTNGVYRSWKQEIDGGEVILKEDK